MTREVVVQSASRLHFGLVAFGDCSTRQFGGVGAMIESPSLVLRASTSDIFRVQGEGCERVEQFARRWWQSRGGVGAPPAQIEIQHAVPAHVGLGAGTQLALSVAAALTALQGPASARPLSAMELVSSPVELAASVGRGQRSAIGTYGFCYGGLVVDGGKETDEPLGRLELREEFPAEWRIVLLRPHAVAGPSGAIEQQHFAILPPVPSAVTDELWRAVHERLLPALRARHCRDFGNAVYHYGITAGGCFASSQGGPFASPELARLVNRLRSWDIAGVGQSSWGPTLFAIVENRGQANDLVERLRVDEPGVEVEITAGCNRGALIRVGDSNGRS